MANGKHNCIIIGSEILEGCLCVARYVCEWGDEVDEPGYVDDEHDFTIKVDPVLKFIDEMKPILIEVLVMKEHGVAES